MKAASSYISLIKYLTGPLFLLAGTTANALDVCYPPELPMIPSSDADIIEYSDIIINDFEHYFKGITFYFACMDRTRQEAFNQYRANSDVYQKFLDRLDAAEERKPIKENTGTDELNTVEQ